ncbi:hypothetical protein [Microvirga makkahensis]|uniref:Uncharacterized protein n=1 Tax=Microvirga makkahensis TaxID=1128670 RepID=A0A7X3SS32_9HYPH|nr:hypothetical protein [Microvirga makkahensis]MXQ14719.1 hypothetical protein [Microvirga makkahensis]
MHHIHLAEGLRLRFPARSIDFDQGVEVGMLAAFMSQDIAQFSRRISKANLGQVRAVAEQFGYRLIEGASVEDCVELTFYSRAVRPRLRVVQSGA